MQQNPTYDILHHAKVSDVITPKAVITLDSEDTVEKAVKVKHCPQLLLGVSTLCLTVVYAVYVVRSWPRTTSSLPL
jgi:hypothetical protein